MTLELLLADAGDRRPALDPGLPEAAAERAPRPPRGPRAATYLDAPDADPNDLPEQRWGVVAPAGERGDRLLDAVAPLLRLRGEEQGAPARIYRVDPGMDARASLLWRDDVYRAADVPEEERPRYLLLLGDFDEVSLELQQALQHGALVGRLHAGDAAGYAAYAGKVVAHAKAPPAHRAPDALFHAVLDGTSATALGQVCLVAPCREAVAARHARGKLPLGAIVDVPGDGDDPGALLAAAAAPRPAVLLSVSHGLGAPRRGWASADAQRALQGALRLGDERVLDAEALRGARFLPGGAWVCVACFGAGTPATSAYHTWLSMLAAEGAPAGPVHAVLRSLPAPGHRPFVAAMPQAALAAPEGPLAVFGHVDLAWTHGFTSPRDPREGRASRFLSALQALLRGSRAGVALEALARSYREADDALLAGYQAEADARARGEPDPTDRAERAHLWMLRNDLRGYVLLGDPAARLPLAAQGAPASG